MSLINEILISLYLLSFFLLTEYNDSPFIRFYSGLAQLAIMGCSIFINVLHVVLNVIVIARFKFLAWYYKRKYRDQMERSIQQENLD